MQFEGLFSIVWQSENFSIQDEFEIAGSDLMSSPDERSGVRDLSREMDRDNGSMGTNDQKKNDREHKFKRCPACFTNLPIDAGECPACKEKVGKRDEYGLARKVFAWKSYLICLIAWTVLGLYIWWAFF